jgi:hypothetical protein
MKKFLFFIILQTVSQLSIAQLQWKTNTDTSEITYEIDSNVIILIYCEPNMKIFYAKDTLECPISNSMILNLEFLDSVNLQISYNRQIIDTIIKDDDIQFRCNNKYLKISNLGKKEVQKEIIMNIFKDANELINGLDITKKKQILKDYEVNSQLNPILEKFKNTNSLQSTSVKQNKMIDNIFNKDVTILSDGLSKFLVSRVKKEMAISFFNDFKAKITDGKYKEMMMIFPNTYQELNLIDEKIYDYETFFPSIRRNLEYDMSHFPNNLRKIVNDTSTNLGLSLSTDDKTRYSLNVGLQLMDNVIDSMHIGRAIEKLDLKNDNSSVKEIRKYFETMQLFSFALRSNDSIRYYLSKDEFNDLVKDTSLLKVFLGLTAQVAELRVKSDGYDSSLPQIIIESAGTITKVQHTLKNIAYELAVLEQSLKDIKKDDGIKKFKIFDYFNAAGNFVVEISNILKNPKEDINQSIKVINSSLGIVSGIANKEYVNTMIHFNRLVQSIPINTLKKYSGISEKQKKALDDFSKCVNIFQKYGSFAATLAEAKDSDEVAKLIEAFAAPVGSWRDKRNSNWNIALDSYVGGSVLREGKPFKSDSTAYFAVSTPVGISISKSLGCWGSITFLGSIIDIGPLTAFRFVNNEEQISKVYLKEIYSPGIFGSWGIGKKIIFNVNGGWQKFTSLKSVGQDQNTIETIVRNGWSIGASVNIPLMTLRNIK